MTDPGQFIAISLLLFLSVALFVRFGWAVLLAMLRRQEAMYDRVLNHQLILDIPPRLAVGLWAGIILVSGFIAWYVIGGLLWFVVGAAVGMVIPNLVVHYLAEQ